MKGEVLRLYSMRFCPFAQVGFFLFSGIASEGNSIELKSARLFEVFRENFLK